MNRFFLSVPICLSLFVVLAEAQAAGEFTVVALPDTQIYSESYPGQFMAQTQWIAANAASENIVFVTHLGDFVNVHDQEFQWDNARVAMDVLDNANIPWGGIPGNHDFLYGDEPDDFTGRRYLERFGPQRFVGKSWYKGASPSGLSNYQVIDAGGGTEILFLHLNLETPPSELSWAQGVLNANRDKPVFVSTHRYLQDAESYTGGVPLVSSGRFPNIWYTFEPAYRPDGIKSEVFFNSFVKANKNIFLVHCGHFHAEFRQSGTNNFGLTVHEILADYQDDPNGGDGWLRLLEFRPELDEIVVRTFSPTRANGSGEFRTGSASQFLLSVDLDDYRSPPGTNLLRFQDGVAGYNGTQDTHVNSDTGGFFETDGPFTNTSFGNSSTIVVDNDWDDSPLGDEPVQGLIRFDDIIGPLVYEGDPVPSQMPPNATVLHGNLSFNVVEDIEIGDEDMLVYRCNTTWSEQSTWNSLGNGLSNDELIGPSKLVKGDNDPNGDTARNIDVTDFVQAWVGGAENHGFAILPENTALIDDGVSLASSESGDVSLRPALDIEFRYPILNRPPVVTPLAASRITCNEGESIVLTMSATDPNPEDPLVFRVNGLDLAFGVGSASLNEVVVMENDGSFEFTGDVRDDEATVDGGMVTVVVENLAPSITALTGDLTVDVDEGFDFEATATDPGILDILSYEWDLDEDGQFDDAVGSSGSHSFAEGGSHVIALRVADEDGGEIYGSFTVTVGLTYPAWAIGYALTGGPDDDDDGDGTSNVDEFNLRFDPTDSTQRLLLVVESVDEENGTVTLRLPFVTNAGTFHIQHVGELSDDPNNWTTVHSYTPVEESERDVLVVHAFAPLPTEGYYRAVFEATP